VMQTGRVAKPRITAPLVPILRGGRGGGGGGRDVTVF
jgi:hypothetical protein